MPTYRTSSGERVTKKEIDIRVRKAKKEKLRLHLEEYGYYFCTKCENNDDTPIDCAHVVSVNDCQKMGYVELAWDLNNIMILGRKCHAEHDKNNIQNVKK